MPNIVITIIIAIVMIAVVIVVTALAASNISVQNYKKNEVIHCEGETPKYLMCLLRGGSRNNY